MVEMLELDQIKFLASTSFSCLLGYLMRKYLQQNINNYQNRLLFTIVGGIIISLFCFNIKILHIFFSISLSYIIMNTFSPEKSYYLTCIFCFLHMTFCHIWRMYNNYGSYELDITGSLMVIVQRLTLLNASLWDGDILNKEDKRELSEIRKEYAIRKKPSLLEFTAYCLNYQTIVIGPLIPYHNFQIFMQGKEEKLLRTDKERELFLKHREEILGAEKRIIVLLKRTLTFGLIHLFIGSQFPISFYTTTEFQSYSFVRKLTYLWSTAIFMRMQYYFAWNFCSIACLISGLGFSGFSQDLKPKYEIVECFIFKSVEFPSSLKEIIDNWNIPTLKWLRIVVFERSPKAYATFLVFFVSIFWHGYYPSYFVFFLSSAWLSAVGRLFRKKLRPVIFQRFTNSYPPTFPTSENWIDRTPLYAKLSKNKIFNSIFCDASLELENSENKVDIEAKDQLNPGYNTFCMIYDIITFIASFTSINYLAISFVLLTSRDSYLAWRNLFFFVHIIGLVIHIGLLNYKPPQKIGKEL